MNLLLKKPWSYSFYEHNRNFIISVVCGSVGLYEVKVQLNEDEEREYLEGGQNYIEILAKKIKKHPKSYIDRNIDNNLKT